MDHAFCPGSRLLRQPKPDVILCPSCGAEVEIWSDEMRASCQICKRTVVREGGMSCLDWCTMGKECVGEETYQRYMNKRATGVKQELLHEMESWFGSDAKRIAHARAVLCFAEELLKREPADWHIVVPAAILHDVGIKVAEEKYGSSAGRYQETEGPPVAREMLLKAGLRAEYIDEICAIIAHHHSPGDNETMNFKVLYDADRLVNVRETTAQMSREKRTVLFRKIFLTQASRDLADETYR